mmetsp:Transcript_23905/g.75305  ORF Transcript_23905/g.75305 Transcript_23905/m.75305 type:complete len:333 (-) Transcript_23905:364-1362(-)|eukprot:CAMPEP_0118854434 /NCGR_PEP_ID=MMETSP1163-20130328/2648_1 /TAXON_ID=124430 /ORGANISM="Phaeomonas parva, Strain CCMP2877" /LENGTH=332 /DNA_ID=CAMNT_0006787157 /DNA_START=232 /DNA_END=1230 /DNA_ORIENTATION=-
MATRTKGYSHSSKPQVVPGKRSRPKYRGGDNAPPPAPQVASLFADQRVRPYETGDTYDDVDLDLARLVEGDYEEIEAEEFEEAVPQTDEDAEVERAEYVPSGIGVDVETQIDKGDLFDFDAEVKPLLEVLVGRTCHIALNELQEETEMARIRDRRSRFEITRDTELAELQRIEALLKRQRNEKERREAQETRRIVETAKLDELVNARGEAAVMMDEVENSVFDNLRLDPTFGNVLAEEIRSTFLPWMVEEVTQACNQVADADDVLDSAIEGAIANSITQHQELTAALAALEAQRKAEEEARLKAEEEARLKAEEEARLKADADAAAEGAEEE